MGQTERFLEPDLKNTFCLIDKLENSLEPDLKNTFCLIDKLEGSLEPDPKNIICLVNIKIKRLRSSRYSNGHSVEVMVVVQ
jgi:hypothetical protein